MTNQSKNSIIKLNTFYKLFILVYGFLYPFWALLATKIQKKNDMPIIIKGK
jgi:hypothetical protein